MSAIRLTLLLAILLALALLAWQNWAPALPIVFLGMQSQPLPLALILLIALGAGALTMLALSALGKLVTFLEVRSLRQESGTNDFRASTVPQSAPPRPNPQPSERVRPPEPEPEPEDADDWFESSSEDWIDEEEFDETEDSDEVEEISDSVPERARDERTQTTDAPRKQPAPEAPTDSSSNSADRPRSPSDTPKEPKTGVRSASLYSYSYREADQPATRRTEVIYTKGNAPRTSNPSNNSQQTPPRPTPERTTPAGRPGQIYDAEFRVLNPPPPASPTYSPPSPPPTRSSQSESEEDWGFEDDEDWNWDEDWEDKSSRR